MADAVDPDELLHVDVDQFARHLPLVADEWQDGVESLQPAKAHPAQNLADRGDGATEWCAMVGPNSRRSSASIVASLSRSSREGLKCGGRSVDRTGAAFYPIAVAPFAHSFAVYAMRRGGGFRSARVKTFDHQHSNARRRYGILMNVN